MRFSCAPFIHTSLFPLEGRAVRQTRREIQYLPKATWSAEHTADCVYPITQLSLFHLEL